VPPAEGEDETVCGNIVRRRGTVNDTGTPCPVWAA
jgi:hypothetical protein